MKATGQLVQPTYQKWYRFVSHSIQLLQVHWSLFGKTIVCLQELCQGHSFRCQLCLSNADLNHHLSRCRRYHHRWLTEH